MSGLSRRVMNMKFMQKADAINESAKQEEEQRKIKDMSEWVLPNSSELKRKRKVSNIVQSVGYASINSFGGVDEFKEEDDIEDKYSTSIARRTWGDSTVSRNQDNQSKLTVTKLKDAIPDKKLSKTNKSSNESTEVESDGKESDVKSKEFLDSLWKKNKTSKKRKQDELQDHVPDIKNKKKRFQNLQ